MTLPSSTKISAMRPGTLAATFAELVELYYLIRYASRDVGPEGHRRIAALVVTRSHGRLRARVVSVAAGARRLVSLVPGALRVRIGGATTTKLRHGAFATVAAGAVRVTVGRVKVALPAGAQLTVLTRHGRRVVGVTRTA